ncbi:MAG: PAS domain-containing protein [Anaerolineales bacterium]|nr:PAS domain-containing protein [Anaerolineales bacterium]
MSQNNSFDETLIRLFKSICEILTFEAGFVILMDPHQNTIVLKLSYKHGDSKLQKNSLLLSHSFVKDCIEQQKPTRVCWPLIPDTLNPAVDSLPGLTVQNLFCAPIYLDGVLIGTLALLNKQSGEIEEEEEEENLLVSLANILASILHTIDLVKELKIVNADLEANRWEIIRSRNILRALFDNVPLSFYIINQSYQLLAVNASRSNRAQMTPQDLVGKRCFEALFSRQSPCPACTAHETMATGENTHRLNHLWSPDSDVEEWEISSYPVFDESNRVSQVILAEEDITEKRQLEYKLIQSEKLAAVGQLAAGIAHEINNPLTAVIANVQLIQRGLSPEHEMQDSLELIGMAGERAAQVVRNLLDLTRKEKYTFVPTDINLTIQKALDLLQHELIAHNITLHYEPNTELPELLASPEHLEGVWINLLSNAFDAVDHTGQGAITITSFRKNNHIQVIITDNGHGIPAERIARLFDPFYTTKATGHGTGLGLTISQRIVKQHGGHIQVDSKTDQGTQFMVFLPIN